MRCLCFLFSHFFFSEVSPHRSLLPLVVLLLLPSFMLFKVLFAAAAVFAFFIDFSQTQWHISIDVVLFESASSFSFQIFVFSRVVNVVVFFTSHACWKVTVDFFELFPAASFTCALCAFDYS